MVGGTRVRVLAALFEHSPLSSREIMDATGLSRSQTYGCLYREWRSGHVLRTADAVIRGEKVFRGRRGTVHHTLPYHMYLPMPSGRDQMVVDGRRYVAFSEEHLDPRGGAGVSKAQRILDYLKENGGEAFFSVEVVDALSGHGVKPGDIMSNVRRYERRGLVYVRGYKGEDRETPFREGYLLAWLDPDLPREEAIADAVARTDAALAGRASSSPTMERIHRFRDIVLEHRSLRKLVSANFVKNSLGCTRHELDTAIERALQLYPDMKTVRLFDAFRYYYHEGLSDEDLAAAKEMKKNYIRKVKGAANRVGHNWEAVAEWFIDRTTTGARFWTQNHRKGGMDPRRITLHLIKGVGGRRQAAEVDRVWEVTPGVFAPAITYVLSCKWGLIYKAHVDDFLEILRWSKSFGVDTPDGREIKQGVVGVFAASAFKPKETVQLKDETRITLAQYAARRNLQLITAADFNKMLRGKGCPKVATVQKICRAARDEAQVREALDAFWERPGDATATLGALRRDNQDIYRFEEKLEAKEVEH